VPWRRSAPARSRTAEPARRPAGGRVCQGMRCRDSAGRRFLSRARARQRRAGRLPRHTRAARRSQESSRHPTAAAPITATSHPQREAPCRHRKSRGRHRLPRAGLRLTCGAAHVGAWPTRASQRGMNVAPSASPVDQGTTRLGRRAAPSSASHTPASAAARVRHQAYRARRHQAHRDSLRWDSYLDVPGTTASRSAACSGNKKRRTRRRASREGSPKTLGRGGARRTHPGRTSTRPPSARRSRLCVSARLMPPSPAGPSVHANSALVRSLSRRCVAKRRPSPAPAA
jgi:hypothetical protein